MNYRDFMSAGYKIFPLYGADRNGHCECGDKECEAVYKHPRMPGWQRTVMFDDEAMESMESVGWFATGYGVLCEGLLVVDVDARNGGVASYERLVADIPAVAQAKLEVITGSGGGSKHVYFSLAPDAPLLVQSLPDYPGLDFKSSGYLCGPGSRHKSGATYEADGYVEEITQAPVDLLALLQRPERHRVDYDGVNIDVSHTDIAEMLSYIANSGLDYDIWIRIGMAIHHATQGTGFHLWDAWSATSDKHNPRSMEAKWHSFGRGVADPATAGTLVYYAEQGGWKMPVAFVSQLEFTDESPATLASGLPFSVDGIDLTQPPGFVGEIAAWIEDQSRRPRRHIAVAGALNAIGNIAGMRFTDDLDGVTMNTFIFCVAGSRTGKESIQQGIIALHRAAGISGACHGNMKSEQEITRNLTRHQAAFYVVDEVGELLQKIQSAKKKGGAIYLNGIIGLLMSVYSKANGWYLLNGDTKEQIKADLVKEYTQTENAMKDGETPFLLARSEAIKTALSSLDRGLDRPFLSLIGFTVPVTFDELVDFESATNGFIGRSLIFNERDTAPRSKKNWKPKPMPPHMEGRLQQLFSQGEYDSMGSGRVENYADRTTIPTNEKAAAMLAVTLDWMEDRAIETKGTSGLEALWLGAYELVSKVSLILAAPEGLRTSEHVRWAFALVKRDIEEKARLVVGNERQKDAPKDALDAKIRNLLAGDEPETLGVIVNRLRQFRKEDIITRLADMVESGSVEEIVSVHSRKGSEIKKYLAKSG